MGPFLLTQALAPRLADGARVANITSELGSIGSVTRFGTPSYNISKAAQNMATVLLAAALQPRGIIVRRAASGLGADRHGRRRRDGDAGRIGRSGLLQVIDGLTARRQRALPRLARQAAAW